MPRKSAKTGTTAQIPRFTIEKPATGTPAIGKLVVPRVTWEALPATLEKIIEKADAAGVKPTTVKGTLTLY